MKEYFIIKAYENASKDRKLLIKENFPDVFKEWYKCENLRSGCRGFNGIGEKVNPITTSHIHGLYQTDKGMNLQQLDGQVWRVDGKFTKLTAQQVINEKRIYLAKQKSIK